MTFGHIKSSEYEAWARLNGVRISPSELWALKKLDRVKVSHIAAKTAPDTAKQPTVESRPMTPELFDALWGVG